VSKDETSDCPLPLLLVYTQFTFLVCFISYANWVLVVR